MSLSHSSGVSLTMLATLISVAAPTQAQRWMENLDRGVVAINQGSDGVFVGWRLLGTDPIDLGFNVYRQSGNGEPVKLNQQPLTGPTHFRDIAADLSQPTRYLVRPVTADEEAEARGSFRLPANPPERRYLSIPLQTPDGYHANDASTGDLDGDGQLDLVVHMVGRGRDNSQSGLTTEPILHAYKLDGTLLWSINLGKNIREGAHYTQFMVFDFDSDGQAEVICKTADGTVDGVGNVVGDAEADPRQMPTSVERQATPFVAQGRVSARQPSQEKETFLQDGRRRREQGQPGRGRGGRRGPGRGSRRGEQRFGYILKGPEYLTVFNGETGAAMATVDYVPQRHPETDSPTAAQMNEVWGDGYGNRIDRFLACVAYLDGAHPSVIMCRGYYTRTVLVAWDWRNGQLTQRWVFDSDVVDPSKQMWRGQGNHSIAVADVDEDGRDEIIYGSLVVDDDGTALYSTGLGHGDAQHTTDLDPSRPGLETWSIHEKPAADRPGVELRNSRTGEIYFDAAHGIDVARGMAADIDPRHPGCEVWGGSNNLFTAGGENLGPRPRSQNMAIWWDGDLLREMLDGVRIVKWDYENGRDVSLFNGREEGVAANNGTKSNPCLSVDILGDWREELIARSADNSEIRIYVSTISTEYRLYTLMHDPIYRLSIAWQNVGYNQPPHPGFFLGDGMAAAPRPNIRLTRTGERPD
jgi:rhamnogalacturonan endolyase